jgi:membrane associated rhomboid family serine protease
VSSPDAEVDGSVCYRHPDRTSWTLCQRCGRTICPECQILTPGGVRCPDCVREAGGSVRWEPAAGRPAAKSAPKRMTRASPQRERPRWMQVVRDILIPGTPPVLTWAIGGIVLVLWIAGFATANAPFIALAAIPGPVWEVWRYFTAELVYPSVGDGRVVVSVILSLIFLVLISPSFERQAGRRRYLVLFFASAAFGAAGMMLAGQIGYGLSGVLWGISGAYIVTIWEHAQARNRSLLFLGAYLIFGLLFGSYSLPAVVGGIIAGVGSMVILRRFDDRPRSSASTPYLIIAGGVVAIIVITSIRILTA